MLDETLSFAPLIGASPTSKNGKQTVSSGLAAESDHTDLLPVSFEYPVKFDLVWKLAEIRVSLCKMELSMDESSDGLQHARKWASQQSGVSPQSALTQGAFLRLHWFLVSNRQKGFVVVPEAVDTLSLASSLNMR